jgi:5-(carboxyamino)imidazole ribonucleotide mutase
MADALILMGSISDEETVRPCAELLEKLGVACAVAVSSAHRTPERTETLVREAERDGCRVFICAAGMAAHLAGAVAARTIRPVIGIPVTASSLGGLDAVLSTLMMPPGFPVATLALDRAGALNAAWLAAQILALDNESLASRLREERAVMARGVEEASRRLSCEPRPSPSAGRLRREGT